VRFEVVRVFQEDLIKVKILQFVEVFKMGLVKCFTFWVFWLEFCDVNLDKIAIFCCLNCISEYINGLSVLKNL
jgi:hypothetical protein